MDRQVKLRGYRIEPGEIEQRLLDHEAVKEAAVIPREGPGNETFLCAYLAAREPGIGSRLREYLSKELPDYMIPSYFVELERLPLTPSGKVNREALPAPGIPVTRTASTAPGNDVEKKLAGIWSDVLNIPFDSIGIDGDFFELGGHSLKAGTMVSRIHEALDIRVPLAEVFKSPTIRGLCRYIRKEAAADIFTSIEAGEEKEYYPLSSAQQRFFLLQQLAPETTAYNMPHILYPLEIDKEKLEETVRKLIQRHESLRTCFQMKGGELVQRIYPAAGIKFTLEYFHTANKSIFKNFIRPFNLSNAPLFRVGLIQTAQRNMLMLDIHHIVSDGTSQKVLSRDYESLYSGSALPPLRLQYRDFARWQHALIRTGEMKIHENYWRRHLEGPLPEINLPIDYPAPAVRGYEGHVLAVALEKEPVRQLHALRHGTGTTLYMVLLAAFNILLFKYTGQGDIIIGSPMASRIHADLEDIIGLVMESIMIRNFPGGEKTFMEFLEEVKQKTLGAIEHQVYPYSELEKKIGYKNGSSGKPITTVGLMVQNIFASGGGAVEERVFIPGTSKLDLTIAAGEGDGTVFLDFEYSTLLFKAETIERLAGHFVKILEEAVGNPGILLSHIDIISDREKTCVMGNPYPCYPLSHAQKRIYYTEKIYPDTPCNSLAFTVRYNKILDKQILEQAINWVIRKNDSLRLRMVEFDFHHEPSQYIVPFKPLELNVLDFSGAAAGYEGGLRQWIEEDVRKPFRFFNGDLYYFAYIKVNENESGFYMKLHHIAADGWALFLLQHEITGIYETLEAGNVVDETPNPSYIDYLFDEITYLKSSRAAADRKFWHNTLVPLPEEVQLFENKINTAVISIEGAAVVLPFPDDLRTKILHYCQIDKTSIFKLLLSVLSIYISRVTGCDDTVIGSFNHNRTTDIHGKMSGMFVSTLPLRINVDQRLDFRAFVEKNGKYVNHILKNRQKYPFDRLAAELRVETGIDPVYLLNVNLIGHPDVPEDKSRMEHYFPGYEPTPLSIHINGNNRNIHGILELEWDYQPRQCSAAEITRIHRCLVNILDDALSHPGKPLWAIELVSGKEKEEILFQFNDTLQAYPSTKTVHRLFEEQAARNPGFTAVVSSNPEGGGPVGSLDYGELNERATRLSVRLRERGAGSDRIIGIMTDRSPYIIIGLLAILKSGAAFLPLDPSNPEWRIGRVLADSGARFVLSRHHLQDTIPSDFEGEIIDMEDERFYECGTENRGTANLPSAKGGSLADLAYVIYTSGSTGTPRGVVVSQGSYLNAAYAWRQEYGLQEMEVNLLQLANFTFDVFVGDAARVLVNGGKMVICSEEARVDPTALYALIREHRITLFESTPALILPLMKYIHENGLPVDCLKLLIVGSDICPLEDFRDLIGRFGDSLRIINSYGVTEATIDTLYYEGKTGTLPEQGNVPVGRPMPNMRVYILSSYGRLQPVGVAGELGIGGEGVARGYLNDPELTSEKFVFVSYRSYKSYRTYISKKIYKTGDLARWLADGCIDFIGRKDQQVKIRGFRIEPGEVRGLLLKQPMVKGAVVASLGNETGDRYLCAYIVPADSNPGEGIDVPALKSKLSRQLPAYMVPGFFVTIEEIPLTANGKIDMKALPVPGVGEFGVGDTYIAPGNRREEILAAIWSEVLGVEKARISITSDFFELGGHSLKASLMLSKVHRQLEVKIPLAEIFVKSTIRELAQYIKSAQREHYDAVEAVEKKEYYPLSSAQKRLYILQQIDDIGSIGYNMPLVTVLEGQVNKTGLGKIFKKLIRRHEIFRTSFELAKDQAVQRIGGEVEFAIEYFNLSAGKAKKRKADHLIKGFIRPFDLSRAPLLRVGLIKKQLQTHILMLDMHHIITDGLSVALFIKEFMAFYGGEELAGLKLQYKDYSEWQNGPVQKQALGSRETYWVNRFREEIPLLHLPCDYKRPLLQSFEGDTINFIITGKEAENLKALAPGENVTLYMVLLAIFNIFLWKLSGSETIIIGTPVSGRRHEDFQSIIGMFVNTLALQNRPAGEKTFHSFLREVKERTLEDFENQDYPFEELVDKVEVSRDTGRNPLFDVMFVFQDLDIPGIRIPGLKLLPYDYERRTAKFDMTLTAMEAKEALLFSLEYCTKLFKEETIRRWITYFKMVVSSVLRNPAVKIGEIEIIGEEEKRRLLFDFNRTEVEYPADKTVHELFAEQVERTPDGVSVIGTAQIVGAPLWAGCAAPHVVPLNDVQLTYKELNEKSNQLAQALKERGVLADDIVGIKMERSVEMIIVILGIIKAGGAYLPIDVNYPQDRIDYMLKDSNARGLLRKSEIRISKSETNPNDRKSNDQNKISTSIVLDFEHLNFEFLNGCPSLGVSDFEFRASNLKIGKAGPANLAYVIYTSGSTGRPKGTMVEHRSLVNRLKWMQKRYGIDRDSTLLQKTPFTFDVSVWEIFWWALVGARLCILAVGAEKDPARLVDTIELKRVSVIHFVPSMLNVFLDYIENAGKAGSISALRQVIASGEALTVPQVRRFSELIYKRNGTKLANLYGPTEATIDVSYYDCDMEKEIDMVPIGNPIDNIRLYIINNNFRLQPVGVTGELCIAGIGLARGYLNKPGLTAEKFENYKQTFKQKFFGGSRGAILQKSPPGRRRQKIYLTGDLARWMVDGDIEFLGRKDGQVKVRGFRIELGEIENKLSGHGKIREVVVLAREDEAGDKYLCAYVVPAVAGDIDGFHGELQRFLSQHLPDYMIPSYLVELESIPLTANGKINRKALPGPKIGEPGLLDAYIAPRNRREDILAAVWSGILGVEKQHIGIDSDFFKLGGHSLKAALMLSKVHRQLNVRIPLAKVFVKSTIRELAGYIEAAQKEYVTPIKKAENKLFYPLSSAQKRLYVLQQMNPGSTGYNIPTVVALEGELNIGQMDLAFRKLVKRHESFRTSFPMIGNKPVQRIHLEVPFVVEYYDITVEWGAEVEMIAKNFIRPFDLSRPPLLRVGIVKTDENKHVLMVDMHHIISDGLSMEIFIREFVRFYNGLELPPLDIQYKDFARWQDRERERGVLKKQGEFWLSRFAGEIPELKLPFDYPEPPVPGFAGSRFGFEVEKDLIIKIKEVLSRTGTTLHQFLLAVYNILLSRYTRQEDIVVGYPVTGRSHADLQPIIGMFVNMLPMRNRPRGNKTFRQFLEEVRENAFSAHENQDYPFEDLVVQLGLQGEAGGNPLFNVAFALHTREGTKTDGAEGMLKVIPVEFEHKVSIFAVTLRAYEAPGALSMVLEYKTALFKRSTMEKYAKRYIEILEQVVENIDLQLKDISVSHELLALKTGVFAGEEGDFRF
jgi:amino acid adenylation domain-containing protein